MQRSAIPVEGIEFTDKYGDQRVVHHNKSANGPLRVKRVGTTPVLALNGPVAVAIGNRVGQERIARGWTQAELAERAGLRGGKQAVWQIENALRFEGMRLGTLYALALAFGMDVAALLPAADAMASEAGLTLSRVPALAVR